MIISERTELDYLATILNWNQQNIADAITGDYGQPEDTYQNPMRAMLNEGRLYDYFDEDDSIESICMVFVALQMETYKWTNGPEQDGDPKALRRHWYSYFKMDVAQSLSMIFNEDIQHTNWGTRWAGRLSKVYGKIIDSTDLTYKDMWVSDASRMIFNTDEELYPCSNIIIAVEKDSLMGDFHNLARRMGALVLYSGKGKSSKAACELILDQLEEEPEDRFTEDNPLTLLTISDFDYDGNAVINKTFGVHFLKYINVKHIKWIHVGVTPSLLNDMEYDLNDVGYTPKLGHKSSKAWAYEKAMKRCTCDTCGTTIITNNQIEQAEESWMNCDECGSLTRHRIGEQNIIGYEVEAMRTSDYYEASVRSLLQVNPFDNIVANLRYHCIPDTEYASEQAALKLLSQNNKEYAGWETEIEELRAKLYKAQQKYIQKLQEQADLMIHDYTDEGDDPTEDQFIRHVNGNSERPWRPFSRFHRTNLLEKDLMDDDDIIEEIKNDSTFE